MVLDQYGRTDDDRRRAERPIPPSRESQQTTEELVNEYLTSYERGKRMYYRMGAASDGWFILANCDRLERVLAQRGVTAKHGEIKDFGQQPPA